MKCTYFVHSSRGIVIEKIAQRPVVENEDHGSNGE